MQVDWLILADAAQVVGGKLYLLGGGWDVLTVVTGFPVQRNCAVAAAFRVDWNETNEPHHIELLIEDEDGQRELVKVEGDVEVGRPPGVPAGFDQRVQLAAEMTLQFETPGTYRIVARVDGEVSHRAPFRVVQAVGFAPGGRPPQVAQGSR